MVVIKSTAAQDVLLAGTSKVVKRGRLLLAAAVLAASGYFAISHYGQLVTADKVVSIEDLRVSTARLGDLRREIVTSGRVVAANSPTLFSPETGFVDLQVAPGDRVTENQTLAVIRSPDLRETLARESAALNRLEVTLQRQEIQTKRRTLELQQTEDLAAINLTAMRREMRRAENARKRQLISQLDFEKARDDLSRAELEHRQALQDNALENEAMTFELRTLQLDVKRQQLLVDSLERRVNALAVVSPVDGMVGNVQIEQRQAVAANQPLITVVDLTAFEVEAQVQEGYADDMSISMAAQISLNGRIYPGELTRISPEVVNSQVITHLRFRGKQPANLRQNQRLTARILLENKPNVLLIDRGPFIDSFNGSLFKKDGDKAVRTHVVLGSTSLQFVEVVDGLTIGDEVIVSSLNIAGDTDALLIAN